MEALDHECSRCHGPRRQAGLWGLCTRCLLADSILAHAALQQPPPLRRFGDFELVRPLGRGGMGIVYEAVEVSLGRRVALKMILEAEGASPATIRRFMLEAETVARLDHPNIVPLYQVGEVNGQPFLSMKLIHGDTLEKKIIDGDFSLCPVAGELTREQARLRMERAVRLMIKIANAVEHAHENEILHRDLKPGNVLVDESGEPFLLDFGLAKMLQNASSAASKSQASGVPGTPSYMSPEQAEGRRLTAASDIYSLGAVLYEMLCGNPPFSAPTPLEVFRKVTQQEAVRPRLLDPRIERDLETICLKCLEKNPAARYRTARALAEDLERWLQHKPILAQPVTLPLRIGRWTSRNRFGTALIGGLCLGLSLALLFLRQSIQRQSKLDVRRANSLQLVSASIEEMWRDPEQASIRIPSSTLADMADLPPRLHDALQIRLTVGNTINHEPYGQAFHYAAFLRELESRLERRTGGAFQVDLALYKHESTAIRDLTRGALQLQRLPAVAYVLARQQSHRLQPLVREINHREAVLFAGKASGITNLSQLIGKRLVLGEPTSDSAFWGKVHLARAGITAPQLASCVHMGGDRDDPTLAAARQMADRDPNTQAHKRAVQEVLASRADAGIVPRRQFELGRYRKQGLVELSSFSISSEIYAASAELPRGIVENLRATLVSFRQPSDHSILARLAESGAPEGFEEISDDDLSSIEEALTREIVQFEGGRLPSKPAGGF